MPHGVSLATLVDVHVPRVPINVQMSVRQVTSGLSNVPAFEPSQLTGLVIWLSSTSITGVDSGSSLSTWIDSSGQGNHVTQTSAVSQPTFQTNAQNGLPAVRFTAANKSWLLGSAYSVAQPLTYFATYKATNKVASYVAVGGPVNNEATIFQNTNGFPNLFGTSILLYPTDRSGLWTIVGGIFNGSSSTLWLNGTSTVSVGAVGTVSHKSFFVGQDQNTNFFLGDIGEIVGYNRILSQSEGSQVFSYLNARWGIPIS